MTYFTLYSKRQKKLRGEVPDIYTHDKIPQNLRVQIIYILDDCIGIHDSYGTNQPAQVYQSIHDFLCREYGKFELLPGYSRMSIKEHVFDFFLYTKNIDEAIDVIELSFRYIDIVIRPNYRDYCYNTIVKMTPDDAISELNERFKEHAIGFSYENKRIIRVDSTYIHSEIVKPTLALLHNQKFAGANEEYLKAHGHYRDGRNKECLVDCLKAFESTMKIICKEKSWPYDEKDTSKKLIQTCFINNIVPSFTQGQFTSLTSLLESGIPTIRNRLGGHGQGNFPQKVDDEMTRYCLNLTAANIIFLVEQSQIV